MHLKQRGDMFLKPTVTLVNEPQRTTVGTGIRSLSGTLYGLLIRLMLCMTLVHALRTGVCGWMLIHLYIVDWTYEQFEELLPEKA